MIKISKNTSGSRVLIFLLSSFPLLLTLVYLFFGSHELIDVTVGLVIITVNIILSWKLAFNDYEIWLDPAQKNVLIKRGKQLDQYPVSEFCRFRIGYYGMLLSNSFKFYQLNIGNKKYRIYFYTSRPDKVTDVMDPGAVLKNIEEEIRQQVCNA
jgi:hypothetical protein